MSADHLSPRVSIYGAFQLPADAFALAETLRTVPAAVVEVERVVATERALTPYFWVSSVERSEFEDAVDDDPTVEGYDCLDEFEEACLYRARWTGNVDSIIYAYTTVGAQVLEASAQQGTWELRMRFDDRDALDQFQSYCTDRSIPFDLVELHEVTTPRTGGGYGLTEKQREALVTAWERGYFDSDRQATLTDVASALDIAPQSVAERLRRGHRSLIEHALVVTPPDEGTEREEEREPAHN
jgi:predicted DNA binding protein